MGIGFFRNPPGRYLGYCHVVGRILPLELVSLSGKLWLQRITLGYIAFDVFYMATDSRRPNALLKGADALIWQALTSVIIPGLVLNAVARGSYNLMYTMKISKPMNRLIPIGLVLVALPLFGGFIDTTVHTVMDNTTRPIMLR